MVQNPSEEKRGEERLDIETPGPGQESVWDYPSPPRCEDSFRHLQVIFNGVVIADTRQGVRLLERGRPPVYFIPPNEVVRECLKASGQTRQLGFGGKAKYFIVTVGERSADQAAWCISNPEEPYLRIKNYIAFYPHLMDACTVDGEIVQPLAGSTHGGWVTTDVVGPFKSEPEQ